MDKVGLFIVFKVLTISVHPKDNFTLTFLKTSHDPGAVVRFWYGRMKKEKYNRRIIFNYWELSSSDLPVRKGLSFLFAAIIFFAIQFGVYSVFSKVKMDIVPITKCKSSF